MSAGTAVVRSVRRQPTDSSDRPRTAVPGPAGRPPRGPARGLRPQPRLLLPPPVDPPPGAVAGVALHRPPVTTSVRSPLTEAVWAPRPEPAAELPELPDPAEVASAIVVAAVEVLSGARPPSQLVRWLSPELHEHVTGERAARGPQLEPVRRARARRATVCRLTTEVVEATVVVHDGQKVRAAAIRLEVHRRRWRATVLEIY